LIPKGQLFEQPVKDARVRCVPGEIGNPLAGEWKPATCRTAALPIPTLLEQDNLGDMLTGEYILRGKR
jgi:hypothetical protein